MTKQEKDDRKKLRDLRASPVQLLLTEIGETLQKFQRELQNRIVTRDENDRGSLHCARCDCIFCTDEIDDDTRRGQAVEKIEKDLQTVARRLGRIRAELLEVIIDPKNWLYHANHTMPGPRRAQARRPRSSKKQPPSARAPAARRGASFSGPRSRTEIADGRLGIASPKVAGDGTADSRPSFGPGGSIMHCHVVEPAAQDAARQPGGGCAACARG